MKLIRSLQNLKKRLSPYRPIVDVMISRAALLHNLNEFKKMHPTQRFAPVLKSNAYGHGLVTVAEILDNEDIPFFMVDSLYEARMLRGAGIRSKILVMGFTFVENIVSLRHKNISFAITSLKQLCDLARDATRPLNIHIKIDTGMHRQGLLPEEIPTAIAELKRNRSLHVEGVFSHFANAYTTNRPATEQQIAVWEKAVAQFKTEFPDIEYFHIANSAGAYFSPHITANISRLGIGLYGFNESPFVTMDLRPALRIETVVSGIKTLRPGDAVGYGSTFVADREMKIATIPVGYFEALDRRLSNRGFVQIHGIDCAIVGIISMNITTVDVSHLPHVQLGDAVTVISNNHSDKNSVLSMSRTIDEIPYVIISHIPEHLRRTVSD